MIDKDDENFKQFIENNKLPRVYEKGSLGVSNYVISLRDLMNKINEKVDESMGDSNTGKKKIKSAGKNKRDQC